MEILLNVNKLLLINKLKDINKKKGVIYILDIDCGYITDLLLEIKNKHKLNIIIDSLTDLNSKEEIKDKNKNFHKMIRKRFVTCSDSSYNDMFYTKKYSYEKMVKSQQDPKNRMMNVFYEIRENDLKLHYDLVCITGPNGNGRDIAFLHLQNRMKKDGLILINELDKYVTLEKMRVFFNTSIIFQNNTSIDRIGLYEIK